MQHIGYNVHILVLFLRPFDVIVAFGPGVLVCPSISSLESNSYDYVATTYYLLAAEYQEKKRNSDDMSESELDMKRLDLRRRRVRKASVPGQGTLIPDSSRYVM